MWSEPVVDINGDWRRERARAHARESVRACARARLHVREMQVVWRGASPASRVMREREREKERGCVTERLRARENERERERLCVRESGRERGEEREI